MLTLDSLSAKMAESKDGNSSSGPILHVVVVGFHHKRGCQIDFSYPPLLEGEPCDGHSIPPEWKHLPFLALPDGAHNYEEDTIYFHLPGRGKHKSTIYAVSCYRQIRTQDLLIKTADVTRGTVQKSVCVLSKLPMYGLIQAKLQLITHAYFCERDFSKTEILQDFFESLNSSLPHSILDDSQVFLGLSLRDLVVTFKHKILVLFKLMLLERRILFYTSPVHKLCNSLLAMVSLFPGMIERGLQESACPKHYCPRVPSLELKDFGIDTGEYLDVNMSQLPNYKHGEKVPDSGGNEEMSKTDKSEKNPRVPLTNPNTNSNKDEGDSDIVSAWEANQDEGATSPAKSSSRTGSFDEENIRESVIEKEGDSNKSGRTLLQLPDDGSAKKLTNERSLEEELMSLIDEELFGTFFNSKAGNEGCKSDSERKDSLRSDLCVDVRKDSLRSDISMDALKGSVCSETSDVGPLPHSGSIQSGDSGISSGHRSSTMSSNQSKFSTFDSGVGEMKIERFSGFDDFVILPNTPQHEPMDVDHFGFPLAIFGKGSLCHPYMSLQQHDLLQDMNVRSFVIGATNVLFKHHRNLMDVIVEVDEGKLSIFDPELRKQLALSTADLRFADFLVKNVTERNADVFLDGTGWEGSDEWIRVQFKLYLLSLLSTCTSIEPSEEIVVESNSTYAQNEIGDFNESFVQAWRTTHNLRIWNSKVHTGIDQIHTGHPFHGHLSVNDMKIRLQSTMQTTDRGKRINSALNRTSVAMLQTGKVVGEALTSAKSAVSSWLYGLTGEWKEEGGE